jgi:pimeloyl-ACP methyl ester carboxylesterase
MTELPLLLRRGPHRLAAVLHRASPRNRRLVILAHGFTGLKSETGRLFVSTARTLAERGLDALRFDFMGSGDSSGEFTAMTPRTEIADLHAVIDWARRRGYRRIGVLGLSLGGGVSICTVAGRPAGQIRALCTWSSVPSFKYWRRRSNDELLDPQNCSRVSPRFFTDLPAVDIPAAYATIRCPKLQIQGDRDLPGFRKWFEKNMRPALPPKRHVIIPGADHVFSQASHRRRVIRLTAGFFEKHLSP